MEKRRKEVAFLAIALLVLGTAVALQMRSGGAPSPAAATTAQPAAKPAAHKPAASPAAKATVVQVASATVPAPAAKPVGKSSRDPFSSPLPAAPSAPGVQVASLPSLGRPFSLPPLRLSPVPPVSPLIATLPGPTTQPAVTTPVAPPPPAVPAGPRLVGIVSGDSPMAIIRSGDQRYYPHVGETAGEYTVQEISARRVVLSSSKGTLSIALGGSNTP